MTFNVRHRLDPPAPADAPHGGTIPIYVDGLVAGLIHVDKMGPQTYVEVETRAGKVGRPR